MAKAAQFIAKLTELMSMAEGMEGADALMDMAQGMRGMRQASTCKWCDLGQCWTHKGNKTAQKNVTPQPQASSSTTPGPQAATCKWCAKGSCWQHQMDQIDYGPQKNSSTSRASPYSQKESLAVSTFRASASNSAPFQRMFTTPSRFPVAAIKMARAELDIVVDGDGLDSQYPPLSSFEELQDVLPEYAYAALSQMGISTPMAIQSQALPIILAGNDVVGVARTGSGKTLAYLLPAIVHIEAQVPLDANVHSPIALALAPTRELAVQISEQALKLAYASKAGGSNHPRGLWAACVYGGMNRQHQMKLAAGAHIVAATPGRLMDHLTKGDFSMDRVTYFVLDEGDRMLDDGFGADMQTIGASIRPDRQMLFFSATWPKKVQDLASSLCQGNRRPIRMRVGQNQDGGAATRRDIEQQVVVFDDKDWDERDRKKQRVLYAHVRQALQLEGAQVLVFVSRKDLATKMAADFNEQGFTADSLHGGRGQEIRLQVLDQFKKFHLRLLVATDVMGRGLDIPTISHVVVFDMGDVDDYVHRVGRTCRGPYGNGHALTLFEYNSKWPHLAEGLIKVLETSGQEVPAELRTIAWDVANGKRKVEAMKAGSKWGGLSGWQGGADQAAWKKLGYDSSAPDGAFQTW
jgi:ATP-dependent RNA helicase DDX5/DBP2